MTALLDTGFALAILSTRDAKHEACIDVLICESDVLLPSPVIPELAYMAGSRGARQNFIAFLQATCSKNNSIIHPNTIDLLRATEIMVQYADANIDFVDCAIMAMAERLNITRILTVGQRDFRMFRPKHTPHFTILP